MLPALDTSQDEGDFATGPPPAYEREGLCSKGLLPLNEKNALREGVDFGCLASELVELTFRSDDNGERRSEKRASCNCESKS